jgi:hypothetical protein
MLALSDSQLQIVITAASLPPEKRSVLLERVAARQPLHGARFTDTDLEVVVRAALMGLQSAA